MDIRNKYLEVCRSAIINSNIDILIFIKEKGFVYTENEFDIAAEHGCIRVMKWLRYINCPWNECTFEEAAKHGNLELVKWLHSVGCPWGRTFYFAVGNLEMMKWLHSAGCPWYVSSAIYDLKRNCRYHDEYRKCNKWLRSFNDEYESDSDKYASSDSNDSQLF